MNDANSTTGDYQKLAELIKDVRVAMMHTFKSLPVQSPDAIHVRPMYTQKLEPKSFNGELFFFSDMTSAKVSELNRNANIMLTYSMPDKERYVVASGTATSEQNPSKAAELWNIHAKGWWPEGPQSSDLSVIRVHISSAEYWDGPSKLSYAVKLLKAVATGERIEPYGEHGRVGR